ncbi:MAG: YqeG family HAD IIIA-type phosphatase [Firmicutes bacterium HGW-Firmicutes-7]|nr:MAG: YqeG family HAD IIIA-type phosphatase [Firmicutes bacterium HGW-Firmicutes-7]
MFERFFPSAFYNSIFDVDYTKLRTEGYEGLMFDIDNTLVPFDVAHPTKEIIDLFTELKAQGFKICLVSNNSETRVFKFNERLKVFAVAKALKPMRRNLRKAMSLMGTEINNSVFIGDQLFTDVWGGNRLGVMTILVTPIVEREEWITKIKRSTEKKIFKMYLKAGKKNE